MTVLYAVYFALALGTAVRLGWVACDEWGAGLPPTNRGKAGIYFALAFFSALWPLCWLYSLLFIIREVRDERSWRA